MEGFGEEAEEGGDLGGWLVWISLRCRARYTHIVLCQPYIRPIVRKLPHIKKQNIRRFRQRSLFLRRSDVEPQHHIPAILRQQRSRKLRAQRPSVARRLSILLRRRRVLRLRVHAKDLLDRGVAQPCQLREHAVGALVIRRFGVAAAEGLGVVAGGGGPWDGYSGDWGEGVEEEEGEERGLLEGEAHCCTVLFVVSRRWRRNGMVALMDAG